MSEFILRKQGEPIPVLILDLISFCNYNCVMCPQGLEKSFDKASLKELKENGQKYRGVMDFELYRSIIDELAEPPVKARVIIPFWNGEPVLYPYFKEAVDYAGKKKKENPDCWEVWSLHSNFSLIDENIAESIIDSELFGPITVSLDACSQEVYSSIRRGGDYNKVLSNIRDFIRIREEKKKRFPSLTIQFIVMEENHNQVNDFISLWKKEFEKYGITPDMIRDEADGMERDCIFIRRLMATDYKKQDYFDNLHKRALVSCGLLEEMTEEKVVVTGEYIKKEEENSDNKEVRREPCVGLWQHFGIRYDGETSACCRDFRCEMSLGNIKQKGLWNIWNSEKLKMFRAYHIKGNFENIKVCAYCTGQPFGQLNSLLLEDYIKSIDMEKELLKYINEIY